MDNSPGNFIEEVLERMTDAFMAVDSGWRITYVNAAAERIAGRSRCDLLGQPLWEACPDLHGSIFEISCRQAMQTQRPVEFETHDAQKDSWMTVRAYPSATGLSLYMQNVTERKKTSLALAASDARYRLIVETANEAIWLGDAEYRTVWINRRTAELIGMPPESALGRPVQEFIYEEDLPELHRRMLERRQGRPASYDIRIRKADGNVFWALARVAPVLGENGAFQGALGMITDITDRKRFEAELHAQRERFQVTLASIGDAVIATDADLRVTFMNRVAEQLTGWREEEASGRPLEEVFRIVELETRAPAESPAAKALRKGKVVGLSRHTALIARNGAECPIDDSGAPIHDASGAIVGVVLVFRDNTERARAEAAQREAARRKDEFLAMLSHELRNPLAPIATSLEIMRLRPDDAAAAARARELIARQLHHLTRLVDDLLDVARISHGRIQLRRARVSVATLVEGALETVGMFIEQRKQRLELAHRHETIVLYVDPTRIIQVIANLLHNASRFTPDGGWIELRAERSGDELLLRVRDNGYGIAPDFLHTVFEPFVQSQAPSGRAQAGLGIGLTLVKTLVELHGGRVQASSAGVGKGSEFTVRLPLGTPADVASRTPLSMADALPPRRVLVVDDNSDAAETLATLLALMGHRSFVAADADSALAQMRRARPDVVLLDIGLPGRSGFDIARQIRGDPQFAHVKLIAVSGYGQADDRRRSAEAGFDLHLVKPVDGETLMSAFKDLFDE